MTQFPSGDSLIIACGGANLGDGPENPIGSFSDSATPEKRTEAGNLLTSIDSALFRELYGATADQIADYTTDKLQ